jgi:Fic family protein
VIEQAEDSIYRCRQFNLLRKRFHSRVKELKDGTSKRTHDVIEHLFINPVFTIASIARQLKVSYPTARSDIQRLTAAGILTVLGEFRPKSYYAHDIVRLAYDDIVLTSGDHSIEGDENDSRNSDHF